MILVTTGVSRGHCRAVEGKNFEGEKIDVNNLEALPRTNTFPSILRMRCAKMCAEELRVTIQSPPGNNISHPEPTRKQLQGTLYQNSPSLVRMSTKSSP